MWNFTIVKIVRRIWDWKNTCSANGEAVHVSSRMQSWAGRKRVQIDLNTISTMPLRRGTNIYSLSKATNVVQTTLYKQIKEGDMFVNIRAIVAYKPNFLKTMYDYVYIDEKWFFLSRWSERYHLHLEEHEPLHTCKNKRFIMKVMFLLTVAWPWVDIIWNQELFGKIGSFPFSYKDLQKWVLTIMWLRLWRQKPLLR